MNLAPGFTQKHVDEINRIANGVLAVVRKGATPFGTRRIKTALMTYNNSLGHFTVGCTECNYICFRRIVEDRHGYINEMNIIVDGTITQYTRDCPVSPDGFAAMEVSFCVAVFRDDIWGERVYLQIGRGSA